MHTESHQIITVTQPSTQIRPSISSHLSFTLGLKHTKTVPPVQRQSYSLTWGPWASVGFLCGGLESHRGRSGSAAFFPAALGSQRGPRTAQFYSPTCTSAQSKCDSWWWIHYATQSSTEAQTNFVKFPLIPALSWAPRTQCFNVSVYDLFNYTSL